MYSDNQHIHRILQDQIRINSAVDARDVWVRTLRATFGHVCELVAMRPVRGADFHRGQIKRAELVSVRDCDGVLRDVLL